MRKISIALCMLLCMGLAGCAQEGYEMVSFRFVRENGSVWGDSFSIEICPEEILQTCYFTEDAREQTVREHIPISAEQWQELKHQLLEMELQEDRESWKEKLFGQKLDGGDSRVLTVIWQAGTKTVKKTYRWPRTPQAQALETALEQLARTES